MDPTQALIDLLKALENEDRDTAAERASILADWLYKGGFIPKVYHHPGLYSDIVTFTIHK